MVYYYVVEVVFQVDVGLVVEELVGVVVEGVVIQFEVVFQLEDGFQVIVQVFGIMEVDV